MAFKNKSFLEKIKKLFRTKTPIGNYIKINETKGFPILQIASKGMRWYKQNIDFTHSQKRESLDFYLKIKRSGRGLIGATKIKILQSLLKREKTTKEISRDIKMSPPVILSHIKGGISYGRGLIKAGLVCKAKNIGNSFLWRLTEKGRKILKNYQGANNNLGLEKHLIGLWIYINPGWTITDLSKFFEIDVSKIREHLKTIINKALLYKRGKETQNDPYRFYLTKKGKDWIKENLDYISVIIRVIYCLGGIGKGKILSLNSKGIRYVIENFQTLKNKIC